MTGNAPTQQEIADSMTLERYLDEPFPADSEGTVWVQATRETKGLLHRAGFKRTREMQNYAVRVIRDGWGVLRMQSAAISYT